MHRSETIVVQYIPTDAIALQRGMIHFIVMHRTELHRVTANDTVSHFNTNPSPRCISLLFPGKAMLPVPSSERGRDEYRKVPQHTGA